MSSDLLAGMVDSTQISTDCHSRFVHLLSDGSEGQPAKYRRKNVIGRGATGQAVIIERVADKQLFVAKIMDLEAMSANDRRYAYSEISCLANCSHFALLRFVEDAEENGMLLLVTEFGDAGDLRKHIKSRAQDGMKYFPERDVWQIFVQLLLAIEYIHSLRVLHRDIKTANVFLTSVGLVKLGDFGFSAQYDETVSSAVAKSLVGTPYYLAPELWKGERYGSKADIWSLGILLYETLALKRPFEATTFKDIRETVLSMKEIPPIPPVYSPELSNIIKMILNPDPLKRPSASELLALPIVVKNLRIFEQNVSVTTGLSAEAKQKIYSDIALFKERAADRVAGVPVVPVGHGAVAIPFESSVKKASQATQQWKDRKLSLSASGKITISVPENRRSITADAADPSKSYEASFNSKEIRNVMPVVQDTFGENIFDIHLNSGQVLRFQAPSYADRDTWIARLQSASGIS